MSPNSWDRYRYQGDGPLTSIPWGSHSSNEIGTTLASLSHWPQSLRPSCQSAVRAIMNLKKYGSSSDSHFARPGPPPKGQEGQDDRPFRYEADQEHGGDDAEGL